MKEKSAKHLTKTLAVVSFFTPITAQPLGIGDIELHSALNQKLNAEIRLHLAPGENPDDVSVRLASPEKFDKAGIPWNYFLSKIKFKPVAQPDGSIIIKVTSQEVLAEPFLDFLLEVVWPQGSQLREFTVLLDPPEGYQPPVIPSATPNTYQIEPLPLEEYQQPVRKARTVTKHATRTETAANITPQTPSTGEYGPIQHSETLWRIAKQLGDERGIPTNTMMMALFRANPDAFNHGDINSMKVGVILKIPNTEAIQQTGKTPSQKKVARKEQISPKKQTLAATKALELVAPTETRIPETALLDERTKPGTASGGPDQSGASGEKIVDSDEKSLELQERIDRLEQQLNMMQQLLALKDQQLAALQNKNTEAAQQLAESAENLQTTQPTVPETTEPQPAPEQTAQAPATLEEKPALSVPTPTQPQPVQPSPAPVAEESDFLSTPTYYLTVGGLGVGILGLLGWLLWRKRKIESQTDTESMFASASQIKLPDADSSLSVPVLDISSTEAYDVGTVGESSFISDFTPSDFATFDTDQAEIDPISEADVYLAYGRYQQAEDLMQQAIKDQPDKDDFKLKLLEIFYASENKERFAAYVQELAEAGKTSDRPFWTKVSDMAKEIIPESPLFGGTGGSASTQAELAASTGPDIDAGLTSSTSQKPSESEIEESFDFFKSTDEADSIDLETLISPADKREESSTTSDLTEKNQADDNHLDFDLNFFEEEEPKSSKPNQTDKDKIESIDFDLSGFTEDTSETYQTKTNTNETLESFDFNFDLSAETPQKENVSTDLEPNVAIKDDVDELDSMNLESFDFADFGNIDAKKEAPGSKSAANHTIDDAASDFDFNFNLDIPPSTESTTDEFDFGVADLTDMDEFETKIDLAKAYIDMGDTVAAKAIAEEVLEKGNKDQKQAAQAILDELK